MKAIRSEQILFLIVILVTLLLTGCQTDYLTAGNSQIRVSLDDLRSTIPGFRANAATILLIIDAPDLPQRQERIPLDAGDWSLPLPAGPARTFSMEVENPHGLLIYLGPDQTLDLVPGATTTLQFPLIPIETIIPLATRTQAHPSQPTAIVIKDATGPMRGLRLDIPARALPQTTTIVVNELYNPAFTPSPSSQASTLVGLGPSGTSFTRTATLTVPYDAALVSALGILETHLQLSYFNPREQTWLPLAQQRIDLSNHRIAASIETLGLYALTVGARPTPIAQSVGMVRDTSKPLISQTAMAAVSPTPVTTGPVATETPPLRSTTRWSNYRLQMQLKPNLRKKVGIIFRHQDEQNYYQFTWDLGQHQAQLIKRHQNKAVILAQQAVTYNPSRSYQLEITAVTNTLQTVIDGQPLFVVTDADVAQGRVALHCAGKQSSCFSDVRIDDVTLRVSQTPRMPHRNFLIKY